MSSADHMPADPTRQAERPEYGFLRLLFASLVVLAHVPAQATANLSSEALVRYAHVNLGDVAVDGFFLVSGYLVTLSFQRSSTASAYFAKRVLRIYPGFAVSFIVCMAVVAPLAGGSLDAVAPRHWPGLLLDILRLRMPESPGAFAGLPYYLLNGPMWTIPYEFRCYVLVAIGGWLGLYRYRRLFALVTLALLCAHVGYRLGFDYPRATLPLLGETYRMVRLASLFATGACFYLFRDRIALTGRGAVIAVAVLALGVWARPLEEFSLALGGGYLVFWSALVAPPSIKRLNTANDVSYGFYLYAWPIAQLLLLVDRTASVPMLILADLGAAALAGALSWFLVERPASRFKPGRSARPPSRA